MRTAIKSVNPVAKVKTWRTPISQMSKKQLVQVYVWLATERDFKISLGRGNYITGTIIWDSAMSPSIKIDEMEMDYPGTLTRMADFGFFVDFCKLMSDLVVAVERLQAEEGIARKHSVEYWDSFAYSAEEFLYNR